MILDDRTQQFQGARHKEDQASPPDMGRGEMKMASSNRLKDASGMAKR